MTATYAVSMPEHTYSLSTGDGQTTSLTVEEAGAGRPFPLLHGGAGPASMRVLATRLAEGLPARTLAPIHPGFGLTDRPDELTSIATRLYATLLDQLALEDVAVIGNSIGGWIAAELALLEPPALTQLILIDAVGIDVPGNPVTDVSGLQVPEIMKLSFHDPSPFLRNPAALSRKNRPHSPQTSAPSPCTPPR